MGRNLTSQPSQKNMNSSPKPNTPFRKKSSLAAIQETSFDNMTDILEKGSTPLKPYSRKYIPQLAKKGFWYY